MIKKKTLFQNNMRKVLLKLKMISRKLMKKREQQRAKSLKMSSKTMAKLQSETKMLRVRITMSRIL